MTNKYEDAYEAYTAEMQRQGYTYDERSANEDEAHSLAIAAAVDAAGSEQSTKIPSGWRATELRSECGRYIVSDYAEGSWYARVLPSYEPLEALEWSLDAAIAACEEHALSTEVDIGAYDANGSPVEP